MAEEGIVIPGEPAEIESRARNTGWVSKEEFDSDPSNQGKKWRPADEYLERGELFNTLRSLKGELTSIKRDFNNLAQHHREVADVEFKRALEALKTQRAEAAEEGDTKAVVDLSEKIDELKDERKQAQQEQKQTQGGVDPLFPIWIEENPEYLSNPEFKAHADALANSFLMQNPGRPFAELLAYVNPKLRDKFPKGGAKKAVVSTVEGSTNGGIPKKANGKLTKADLSDDERDIMRTFIRRGVFKTEQEYIDELAKVKGN